MVTIVRVLTALALLMPAAAGAQQGGGIVIKTASEIEVKQKNAEGKEVVKRVDATTVQVLPGETVIYTNQYTYNGDKPATDVVIRNPVPEHMVYLDGSAEGKGARIEFSVDKGKTFAAAGKLTVRGADGRERQASAADYTHIQWVMEAPLKKGAKGSVSYKAKVK